MEESQYGSTLLLRLTGPLDEDTATALQARIESASATAVVVDLRECDPPTGGAVETLRRIDRDGHRVCFVGGAHLPDDLPVEETIEAALAGLLSQVDAELRNRLRQLDSMPDIEQVRGMLRQDFGLDGEHAMDYLKRLSQNSNVPVRDLARMLVERLSGTATKDTGRITLTAITELREVLRAQRQAEDPTD